MTNVLYLMFLLLAMAVDAAFIGACVGVWQRRRDDRRWARERGLRRVPRYIKPGPELW